MNAQVQPASSENETLPCALQCADVAGRSSPAWWPDARVFTVALTRRYFRELPLHRILVPSLDGPTLCFPWRLEAQSEVWRAELGELRDSYASAQSAASREHKVGKISRATLKRLSDDANRARRVHLVRVAAAWGYTWPGSLGCYFVEFAE